MNDALAKRQAALRLRVAGERLPAICRAGQRTAPWLHKGWKRDLRLGPEGLSDLTRANQPVVKRLPPVGPEYLKQLKSLTMLTGVIIFERSLRAPIYRSG